MVTLNRLIQEDKAKLERISEYLDGLDVEARKQAISTVGGQKKQAKLFKIAEEAPGCSIENLIGTDREPLQPVIFYGKNSLIPPFTVFQKRMCRTSDGEGIVGYNEQSMRVFTGPGYFTVRNSPGELGPVAIDYTQLPIERADGWPEIQPNSILRSRLVYFDMVDYLRPVAQGVYIGRAVKGGRLTDNYFLLSREY